MGQKCLQACSCVTELDHAAKKSRLNLCHLAADQKACDEGSLSLAELDNDREGSSHSPKEPSFPGSPINPSGIQTPPHLFRSLCGKDVEVVDKENSSPERKNWLSALGEKLRTGRAGSQNASNSPPSSCSPGARRQEAVAVATSPKTVSRLLSNSGDERSYPSCHAPVVCCLLLRHSKNYLIPLIMDKRDDFWPNKPDTLMLLPTNPLCAEIAFLGWWCPSF